MVVVKFKNTWVSFLNVSLEMHADFIDGRQKIIGLELQ